MKKSKFNDSEIFKILKAYDSGLKVVDLCRQYGIASSTLYKWRSKYGGMDLPMLKAYKQLEIENSQLKKMFAEVSLERDVLKDVVEKKF